MNNKSSPATEASGPVRKRLEFDAATWHALRRLALDSGCSLQDLANEAFRDLLRKRHRPVTLQDALRQSARLQPANEQPAASVHRLRPRRAALDR